jgi:hypothetical protein
LEYRNGKATGVLPLPALPKDDVYWTQPVYENGAGPTLWLMATAYMPQRVREGKP